MSRKFLLLLPLTLAACAQADIERFLAPMAPLERCVEARHIKTYAMLSNRTVAVGDANGASIAEMDVPGATRIGLRHIRLRPEEPFAVIAPDGLLCNRSPIAARVSYGGREAAIAHVQFVRPAPLGFGAPGVPFADRGPGVPIFARADRPATGEAATETR
jgi:hypothetical protein